MLWRALITAVAWTAGFSCQMWDGQSFRHAVEMLVAVSVGALPWIPLLFREKGTRGRLAAIAFVMLSAVIIAALTASLPGAWEAQRSFNARSGG